MRRFFVGLAALAACNGSAINAPQTSAFEIRVVEVDDTPIAGALVALDDGRKTRVEGVTDTNGKATLQIDWAHGPAALTVHADGHIITTLLALEERTTIRFPLRVLPLAAAVQSVTGNLRHLVDDSDFVVVSASTPAEFYQGPLPTYQLGLFDDRPYRMFALEFSVGGPTPEVLQTFKKWVEVEAPAPSQGAADIDFDTAKVLTPVRRTNEVVLPGGASGSFANDTDAYATVTDAASRYTSFLGAPLVANVSADKSRFQLDLEFVQPDGIDEPLTAYFVTRSDGAFSMVQNDGYPPADAVIEPLDIPVVTSTSVKFGEPLAFQAPAGSVNTNMVIVQNPGRPSQKDVWVVEAPEGMPLTIPEPPSGVDALLPATGLGAIVYACDTPTMGYCRKLSGSAPFTVTR